MRNECAPYGLEKARQFGGPFCVWAWETDDAPLWTLCAAACGFDFARAVRRIWASYLTQSRRGQSEGLSLSATACAL